MFSSKVLASVSRIWLTSKKILRRPVTLKSFSHNQLHVHLISPNAGEHNELMRDIEQQCGCVVTYFNSPEATFTTSRPNLIILDMTDRQGVEFVECPQDLFSISRYRSV